MLYAAIIRATSASGVSGGQVIVPGCIASATRVVTSAWFMPSIFAAASAAGIGARSDPASDNYGVAGGGP